jgi:hypothetical protein
LKNNCQKIFQKFNCQKLFEKITVNKNLKNLTVNKNLKNLTVKKYLKKRSKLKANSQYKGIILNAFTYNNYFVAEKYKKAY